MKNVSSMTAIVVSFFLFQLSNSMGEAHAFDNRIADDNLLIIRVGTLIDGTGAAPRDNGSIFIKGNKIQKIFPSKDKSVPEDAETIDATGKYILPGLIDGHTHYASHAGPLYLHYGITTVIDTGNYPPWIYDIRRAIEQGIASGPRIYTAGSLIDNPPPVFLQSLGLVETVEAARKAVQDHISSGADAIKVYKQLRPELLEAVIDEAHSHGLSVTGHIAISARDAVLMGLDSIEHASGIQIATTSNEAFLEQVRSLRYTDTGYMVNHETFPESFYYVDTDQFPDLIQLLVKRGTFVTPTVVCYWIGVHRFSDKYEKEDRQLLSDPRYAFIPDLDRRWIMKAYRGGPRRLDREQELISGIF